MRYHAHVRLTAISLHDLTHTHIATQCNRNCQYHYDWRSVVLQFQQQTGSQFGNLATELRPQLIIQVNDRSAASVTTNKLIEYVQRRNC
jgi:hypothetical protein